MCLEDGVIKVRYDGKGEKLKKHQMKANDVAKSIKAMEVIYAEAFREASKVFKTNAKAEMFLEAGFQEGSLWWLLKLVGIHNEEQKILGSKTIFLTVSKAIKVVCQVIKKLPPESVEIFIKETPDGYLIEIDGELVVLDEIECAILTNENIRNALSDLALPLNESGVDSLDIDNVNNPNLSFHISKESSRNFIVRRKHKQIVDTGESRGFFYVDTLSYNPKSKWKFVSKDDSLFTFSALIVDPVFLKRVSENAERFSKDDLLEISYSWYKERSRLTGKVKAIYTVIEVEKHIPVEDRQWKLV